ncbi:reverse transcriptase domain-containing protein, partial [Tanacetum coccineum]
MPPRMTTRSAGRQTAASRVGRTGGRTGRGGGRTGERTSRDEWFLIMGDQMSRRWTKGVGQFRSDEVPDFSTVIAQKLQDLLPTIIAQVGNHASNIQGDVKGVNMGNGRIGCSYKEFMPCNPKDYDGKGDAIVYTHWIEKMESVQTRGREAAVGMTWEEFNVLMSKEFCLNNKMQKLETEFWCHAMVRVGHVVYTDRFHELARLVPHLVTLENKRIERYIYGLAAYRSCDWAACPRLTRAPRLGGNRLNQPMAIEGCQSRGSNGNQARGGAFMMGAEEARQDSNIMTEPSDLCFSYEIEIASGKLVEINKVIRGCKLEIEGH